MCTWDLGINGSLLARHPQSAPSFGTCNTCPGGKKNLLQQPTGHSETHCYERGGYLAGSGIAGGRSRSWRESHLFRTVPAVTPGLLQALSKLPTIAASLWGLTPAPRKSSSGKPTLFAFYFAPFPACTAGRLFRNKVLGSLLVPNLGLFTQWRKDCSG